MRASPLILFFKSDGPGSHPHRGRLGVPGGSLPNESLPDGAPQLPSSAHIATAAQARDYWRANFGGKTFSLVMRVSKGANARTFDLKVDFSANNAHGWTRKAESDEPADAYDKPHHRKDPRIFHRERAVLLDQMFAAITRPWKIVVQHHDDRRHVYVGTRLPDGRVYTVVLTVEGRGGYSFTSAYPRDPQEVARLINPGNSAPTLPNGIERRRTK